MIGLGGGAVGCISGLVGETSVEKLVLICIVVSCRVVCRNDTVFKKLSFAEVE